jgi:hypothetical protein
MSSTASPALVRYLSICPPIEAYKWLETSTIKPVVGNDYATDSGEQGDIRDLIDFILLRRREPLIDLGLAQFGVNPLVLKRVFKRCGTSERCAVLMSPCLRGRAGEGIDLVIKLKPVVTKGKMRELKALVSNPYLWPEFYENLIERKEYFAKLPETTYKSLLIELGENPRLRTQYNGNDEAGYQDSRYNRVFSKAWALTKTAPATQGWAATLYYLLKDAVQPRGFDSVPETLARWEIDLPTAKGDKHPYLGESFNLRSRIADLLEPDEALLNSKDAALRCSFYRRFSPEKFKEWEEFAKRDGQRFINAALWNTNLWKIFEYRMMLSSLCFTNYEPDPVISNSEIYDSFEDKFKKEYPQWFEEEDEADERLIGKISGAVRCLLVEFDMSVRDLECYRDLRQRIEDLFDNISAKTEIQLSETESRLNAVLGRLFHQNRPWWRL